MPGGDLYGKSGNRTANAIVQAISASPLPLGPSFTNADFDSFVFGWAIDKQP
jgi:hypothetical protein